jgi:crotonobetainyl-CoA:carnitine CoA-transferase CaiB-like acyl-CoA transferase
MSKPLGSLPCEGLRVVEVAVGASDLGLGLAGGVPGMMLADLGAAVVRVVATEPPAIDARVRWGHAWHRDKQIIASDEPDEIRALLLDADVALVYGSEALVEGRGLGYVDLESECPSLIYARCRPSRMASGPVDDYALLVEARAGFLSQLEGHRQGPIFVNVHASGSGAALLQVSSVFALLRRRALSGRGGWAETSLYDGLLATLGCMIGRSERAAPEIELYWEKGSTFPNFLYRCADDELIQVWFGGKGMYLSLIEVLGDEPSPRGYYDDQMTGQLGERARRWRAIFATKDRDDWIAQLRGAGIACEPVLSPGEALSDPHLLETGLAREAKSASGGEIFAATPIEITELGGPQTQAGRGPVEAGGPLLDGVKVLDFSAFVAGPLAAEVLADLGAEVIKVEPPGGEAMRAAAYAVAACQRGKRSLAMDINAPEARPVVEALIRWADVVMHNFRVGVSDRLGIDETTVARLNPRAVYCHASAFGTSGPRATFPGNDALMQALTGFERGVGGPGNEPTAATWIPIDMTGGWVAASGILAALFCQAADGAGRRVATSLLGAGMLLQSGVYQRGGHPVCEPQLDAAQTGYGPGYRLYQGGDGAWLALVLPDEASWERLRSIEEFSALAASYVPLRFGSDAQGAREAEELIERGFASAPRDAWVARLRTLELLVEPVDEISRDRFRQGILDDPLNRQLGRVASYETTDWGFFEQIGPLLRCGPDAELAPTLRLPGIGEHTEEVLRELGIAEGELQGLIEAGVAHQG